MMDLLKKLCSIHAPAGDEGALKAFLLEYIYENQQSWKVKPTIVHGEEFQDCLILEFGTPRTAVFAHMDSIGFTVRYEDQLVSIGGPEVETGYQLVGKDGLGAIACELQVDEDHRLRYKFGRPIATGTSLTFACNYREDEDYVQSCYLDNRLGIYNALKVCETLENGAIVFSCWEEHGGGSVAYLTKYLYEKWRIKQALISDITWVTDGVHHGLGVVLSMRDSGIPRQSFIRKIIALADSGGIPYQLEVEGSGGSDGREIQQAPYPIDWCFIGAPEDHVHSPDEKVHKKDISAMVSLYRLLLEEL